jgi:hypothetical protein
MTLTTEAWLEIDDGAGTTGQFQLQVNLEESTQMEKSFIMGRGGTIQKIVDNIVQFKNIVDIENRRTGFTIDAGLGEETITLTFETGLEDVTWGDGSGGGTGPSNVTTTDASGADVKPLVRKQILEYWLRRTRTDSFGQARLHWGEWTDGTVGGASAGVFNQPIPVAIQSYNNDAPNPEETQASMTGIITMNRVALFPTDQLPDYIVDAAEKIQQQLQGVQDR